MKKQIITFLCVLTLCGSAFACVPHPTLPNTWICANNDYPGALQGYSEFEGGNIAYIEPNDEQACMGPPPSSGSCNDAPPKFICIINGKGAWQQSGDGKSVVCGDW